MGNTENCCRNIENDTNKISIPNKSLHSLTISNSNYTISSQFTPSANTPFSPPIPLTPFPSISINKPLQRIVPDRFAELAAHFWRNTIESCSIEHRLEISCSIWFGMMTASIEIHKLSTFKFKRNNDLEMAAFRNLDMIGFIIRSVHANLSLNVGSNADLSSMLNKLGTLHNKMGIKSEYYAIMFDQLNQTLKYYFPNKYTAQIEFAISEIFTYTAQIMCGSDIKIPTPCKNISFLHTLRCCISDTIGKEYLYKYLNNVYCEEMAMFLYLLSVYKSTKQLTKRYLIAKNIAKICINSDGLFAVNISYELRQDILCRIDSTNYDMMNVDFFIDIEDEICRLIMQTHWKKFKAQTNELYLSTND